MIPCAARSPVLAPRITLNGRFLAAKQTGVQRVATNLIAALDHCLLENHPTVHAELLTPRGVAPRFPLCRIRKREVGRLSGVAWEQSELALQANGANLINLCNGAPIAIRSALTMIHDAQIYLTPQSYSHSFVQWYRFALPKIATQADLVLTVSEFSRRMLAEHGVSAEANTAVVYNGVDHVLGIEPDPAAVAALGIGDHPYVAIFGNLQAHKNVQVVLRAFRSARLAGLKLVVVGPVSAKRMAAAFGPSPANVIFAGRLNDGALRALIEGAACLAFPSRTEGFGLPPLEAMILGCPAVVAPTGALPEVCADAAIYADPDDPDAWIAAFERLTGRPTERALMVVRGRRQASRFTWMSSARQVLNLLDRVAA